MQNVLRLKVRQRQLLYIGALTAISAAVCLTTMGKLDAKHIVPVLFGWCGGVGCCAMVFLVASTEEETVAK